VKNFNIRLPGFPEIKGMRVNVIPERGTISIRDHGIRTSVGLDRYEASALARALTQAVEVLDNHTNQTTETRHTRGRTGHTVIISQPAETRDPLIGELRMVS